MATVREDDYRIVLAASFSELIELVNNHLDHGRVTVGGPQVISYEAVKLHAPDLSNTNWVWFQSVVYRYMEEGS